MKREKARNKRKRNKILHLIKSLTNNGTSGTPGQGSASQAQGGAPQGAGSGMQLAQGATLLMLIWGGPPTPLAGQLAAGQQYPGGGQGANPQPAGGNEGAQQGGGYLATFYTGQLPTSRGTVTSAFSVKGLPATQRDNAEALYHFLVRAQNDLRDFNGDYTLFIVLVSIPASCKEKIIYGMGFGMAGSGHTSLVDGKLLALYSKEEGSWDLHKRLC